MKVLITKPPEGLWPENSSLVKDLRTSFPELDIKFAKTVEQELNEIGNTDVYYGWLTTEVFVAADKLKWIHTPGVGIDRLTAVPGLVESDVVLTNSPGPHANVMADHVLGMVVALSHRFGEAWDDQRAHHWDTGKYTARFSELSGSTMGILSMGQIGIAVAKRAKAFDMDVYGVDLNPKPTPVVEQVWGLDRLDELMNLSDWFVVAAPYTSETHRMINGKRLAQLKDGSYLIVISRGGIVDEDALVQGLQSGRIAGAGLDATEIEPLPSDSPLWELNTIISPHSSASTPEMYAGREAVFKENLRRFLVDEPFIRVCDKRAGF